MCYNVRMNQPQLGGAIPDWSIMDRLVKARAHASLNQQRLGELLGVSERTVKRYEAGGPRKRGIILGWALACGVNPEWLEHGHIPTTGDDEGERADTPANILGYIPREDHYYNLVAA